MTSFNKQIQRICAINKQIQRICVPRQDFFNKNKESSENVKFIGGVTLSRFIL